jgi:hypothetical protein
LRPASDTPDEVWEHIRGVPSINNPGEVFEYALSYKAKTRLEKFSDELRL